MAGLEDYAINTDPEDAAPPADVEEGDTPVHDAEPQIAKLLRWADPARTPNLAEELTDEALTAIAIRVVEEYQIDDNSRSEWVKTAREALDMSLQRAKPKTTPWPGASNVIIPIITEAADQFAARAYPAIIDNANVVKGKVIGDDDGTPLQDMTGQPAIDPATGAPAWAVEPGEKRRRGDAIADHMSYQLLEEQPEWERETDMMLHVLPAVGCEFRKIYYDPVMARNMAVRVSALKLVVNYWAKSLNTAPRATEEIDLYPYEIEEHMASGYFLRHDFGVSNTGTDSQDRDSPHAFLEQHRRYDLDGDGYPEPYIVTVHRETEKVVRITARYDRESIIADADGKVVKIDPIHYYEQYDFLPNREGGLYGLGFGHLLRGLNESANTALNQIFDAENLRIRGGGFIGKGLSLHAGTMTFKMGEWKVVNAPGGAIRDAIVPVTHTGSSETMFKLLGFLIDLAKDVSSVKDVLTGDLKAQTMSPTVFMALIEQGLKVFTGVWKRLRRSLTGEFDKLYRLNRVYLEDQASYKRGNEWRKVSRRDYQMGSGVEPISDANMVVDAQKMARAQFLEQFKDDPLMDGVAIRRRMLDAASIPDADALIKPPSNDPPPQLLLEMAKIETQRIAAHAAAVRDYAAAVKSMADADAIITEPHFAWASEQLKFIEGRLDAVAKQNDAAGGGGAQPPAIPGMEAPPGDAGLPPLPLGPAPSANGGAQPALGGGQALA